jgi:prepilin-type N-terminal cleavage/methylation domain-containing protein
VAQGGPSAAQGGFVLLEVLVALVIFATIVLAYAKGTDNALVAATEANSDRTLRMLTSRKLAEIRAKPAEVRDGGEGGFDEEVTPGEESPFAEYRWQVEAKEVVVAGYSAENDAEFLFERDREGGTPKTADGSKAPDPVTLLRLTLVVSRIPEGEEEGERMRTVTYVPVPKEETTTAGTR